MRDFSAYGNSPDYSEVNAKELAKKILKQTLPYDLHGISLCPSQIKTNELIKLNKKRKEIIEDIKKRTRRDLEKEILEFKKHL